MGLVLFLQGPVQQAVSTGPVQPWNQCKSVGLAPLSGSKFSNIFMIIMLPDFRLKSGTPTR